MMKRLKNKKSFLCVHVQRRDANAPPVWPDNISLMKLPAKMRRWKFHCHRRKGDALPPALPSFFSLIYRSRALLYVYTHTLGRLFKFLITTPTSAAGEEAVEPQKKNSTSSIRSSHVQLFAPLLSTLLCLYSFRIINPRERHSTNREQRRHLTIRVHIYESYSPNCKDTLVFEILKDIVLASIYWAGSSVSRSITKPPTRVRSNNLFIYLTINI